VIKVLIADDQELIRESLKIVLSSYKDIEVVDAVDDGFAVLESMKKDQQDLVLMDIRMPKMDGVLVTKAVKENYPNFKVIILTTFYDDYFIFKDIQYGASGYNLKGISM
jgi:DNA-binding NarL/FixJ family response regulator